MKKLLRSPVPRAQSLAYKCLHQDFISNLKLIEHLSPVDPLHFATVSKFKSFLEKTQHSLVTGQLRLKDR